MATTAKKNGSTLNGLESAAQQVRGTGERLVEASRKGTSVYLDSVEKTVAGLAAFERALGEQASIDAVGKLLGAHADLAQDLTTVTVSATRELIA
jgi:hypothetical protein